MQIYSISPFTYPNYKKSTTATTFGRGGKPIDLKYIVKNRSNLLPDEILKRAREIVASGGENMPSLKEVHSERYLPLLAMESLAEVKLHYPEFSAIADSVTFERDTVFKTRFEEKTTGINFPLKMLQELWGNLRTKDEVAHELGFKSRSSIDWALNQIGFVYFPPNYRTLIKSSDEEGNREIAQKTEAYNAAHPDLMYAKNKHAAQFCKTPEYRAAQRERMLEYDRLHPERAEKISEFDKRTWELCPEVKDAMSIFAKEESSYTRGVLKKKIEGRSLTEYEQRINKAFFKRFWTAYPELRHVLAAAKAQIRKEMGKN